ncbi:MAG: hypothetical protein LBR26_10970 [Prevotella sp.]|nr:hypothetical protein [Prevotella sp.]
MNHINRVQTSPRPGTVTTTATNNVGSNGNYRSSSANNGTNAYNLNFNSSNVNPNNNNNERTNGFSTRCVRAFISVFQSLFKFCLSSGLSAFFRV